MAQMQGDSADLLRVFIDQAPAPIAMFDMEMRYIAASRRWVSDYHLEKREWRGASHYEVFTDLPDRWRGIHRRGLVPHSELSATHEDGEAQADLEARHSLEAQARVALAVFDAERQIGPYLLLRQGTRGPGALDARPVHRLNGTRNSQRICSLEGETNRDRGQAKWMT